MGVAVWPMVELEADDALASAARIASASRRVEKVCIWTPDKDLAQCVRGTRVVQVDRKSGKIRDADGVREKFGVEPALIPDYLALVGDAADGYPGIAGIGPVGAARLLNRHGPIEALPARGPRREPRTRAPVQASSRRSARTRRSSGTWRRSGGAARRRSSRPGPRASRTPVSWSDASPRRSKLPFDAIFRQIVSRSRAPSSSRPLSFRPSPPAPPSPPRSPTSRGRKPTSRSS